MRRQFSATLAALLFVILAAGCVPVKNAAAPPASPAPAAQLYAYETNPFAWLEQRVKDFPPDPSHKLSREETARLNELAYLLARTEPFYFAGKLKKSAIILPLYVYYQGQYTYSQGTDSYGIREGLAYPPDAAEEIGGIVYIKASPDKANAFVRALWGLDIPGLSDDYREQGDNLACRQGVYKIRQNTYESMRFSLRAYQYLGDDVFYVSFDGDDRDITYPPKEKKGNIPDYCRLLVVRSGSAWGFTVKAKLKEGDASLLPTRFPLPLYAA